MEIPICITCHRRMTCIKNGVIVKAVGENPEWHTFSAADMYACSGCGNRQVAGFSKEHVAPNEPLFVTFTKQWEAQEPEYKVWYRTIPRKE